MSVGGGPAPADYMWADPAEADGPYHASEPRAETIERGGHPAGTGASG